MSRKGSPWLENPYKAIKFAPCLKIKPMAPPMSIKNNIFDKFWGCEKKKKNKTKNYQKHTLKTTNKNKKNT